MNVSSPDDEQAGLRERAAKLLERAKARRAQIEEEQRAQQKQYYATRRAAGDTVRKWQQNVSADREAELSNYEYDEAELSDNEYDEAELSDYAYDKARRLADTVRDRYRYPHSESKQQQANAALAILKHKAKSCPIAREQLQMLERENADGLVGFENADGSVGFDKYAKYGMIILVLVVPAVIYTYLYQQQQ